MAIRQINKYLEDLQTKLFPALQDSYNLIINESPTKVSNTLATFVGQIDGDRVILEFSSNHRDLSDYNNEPVLFLYLYYKSKGTKAGIINLNNIDEALDIIYASLYSLGYRSQEDIEEERRKIEKDKEKKIQDEKERLKKRKEELLSQPEEEKDDDIDNEEDESESSLVEMNSDFDRYLSILKENNQPNSQINATISYPSDDNNFKVVNVYIFYITKNQCLVQTEGIKPKIDQQSTWEKAKNYLINVTKKINGAIVLSALDENGKEIILKSDDNLESNNDSDLDLGIEI